MSVLTKIFIVLHVVMSLVLAAGLVVFVNRQEHFKAEAATAKLEVATQIAKATAAQQEADKVHAASRIEVAKAQAQVKSQDVIDTQNAAALTAKDVQIATLTTDKTIANQARDAKDAELKIARNELEIVQKNYDAAAAETDKSKVKYAELERDHNRLSAELQIGKKNVALEAETIADLKLDLKQARELLDKYKIDISGQNPTKAVLNTEPAVNINGVVRATQIISGVPCATISLGRADAVTKGMQFHVVDHGKYMGVLTIELVDTHEATGILQGPGAKDVRADSVVSTHLN